MWRTASQRSAVPARTSSWTWAFSPIEASRLHRNIRLLIDDGERGIRDASLGSANLVFLSLKALELEQSIVDGNRNHTLLAIEEPEAHLHPHLQRSVYRHFFEGLDAVRGDPVSVVLTTHSPHIASVTPLRSIVLLKDTADRGSVGSSTAALDLTDTEQEDLGRYLDVTRAEMLFARGILLVEGEAERFLLPVFARDSRCRPRPPGHFRMLGRRNPFWDLRQIPDIAGDSICGPY